jgi:hypothetical protein
MRHGLSAAESVFNMTGFSLHEAKQTRRVLKTLRVYPGIRC